MAQHSHVHHIRILGIDHDAADVDALAADIVGDEAAKLVVAEAADPRIPAIAAATSTRAKRRILPSFGLGLPNTEGSREQWRLRSGHPDRSKCAGGELNAIPA